ncbi:phospholipase D-like domain-containing protein [uncultured Brachyspira sp.]|uniref:phospholipase D-like domain-containing protein n=1 Tax=uncultured Brachyspira sp. TaxID=221953 RepID=UPI00338F189A
MKENEDIYIATAFFSDIDFIKKAIDKNCNIKLIVRISLATSMQRLKEISEMNNVNIRFFTSNKFHPKLYIFGNSIAFIGSSNLTQSGLKSNQEINISIESENTIFDDLQSLFDEYWEQAEVLDNNYIQKFIEIEEKYYDIYRNLNNYQNDIKEIKECEFENITIVGKKKQSKEATFISDFKKKYQLFFKQL